MQHGPLTPLGRQLRSVLANITAHKPVNTTGLRSRTFTSSFSRRQRNAVEPLPDVHGSHATSEVDKLFWDTHLESGVTIEKGGVGQHNQQPGSDRLLFRKRWIGEGWRQGRRQKTRIDHLTEALQETSQLAEDPSKSRNKIDYTYADPQGHIPFGQRELEQHVSEDKRHARLHDLSLQRILGDYIRHKAKSVDYLAAEWEMPFELSSEYAEFLDSKGRTLQDIEAWAAIATAQDSFEAAQKIAQYAERRSAYSLPIFLYLNILKRSYISARALRLLISHAKTVLFRDLAHVPLEDLDDDRHPILLSVIRLLRHAREVWPQSMASIVQLMLDHLQHRESVQSYDREELSTVTYELNKIMVQVSYTTATQPFKDNPHQEAAVVPILRYMAEHDPPLHIDRQGYRAVIRIQLAQRKTPNELQWAELKALSWPPWKADRTAMDASIDAEYGMSRAGMTLVRMKEAGYRPLAWEKTAQLYTGWDPDGTPTVQMRALHEGPSSRMPARPGQEQNWAAKISSTRTIQEAWACYLAWEDQKLADDQGVYLAILVKLREEELRRRGLQNYRYGDHSRKAWRLLPGDTVEIAPLPPSTHLYTYTRTPPPTVEDFYETMISRNVEFKGHSLAFLIQHATTLQEAVQRIKNGCSTYPDLAGVLVSDSTCDITKIPSPIYAAVVEMFAHFGRVPLTKALVERRSPNLPPSNKFRSVEQNLNPALSITRAVDLLRDRAIVHRRLWAVLLKGLTQAKNYAGLSAAFSLQFKHSARSWRLHGDARENKDHDDSQSLNQQPLQIRRHAGAINAHRIVRRMLALMRENHVDLDIMAFHRFCVSTESMLVAAWAILQKSVLDEEAGVKNEKAFHLLRDTTKSSLNRQRHHERLKGEFRILVGDEQTGLPAETAPSATNDIVNVPRLLVVPGPAILHAYIRALGWLADYDGLLATVRWMRDNRSELAERQSHDRNGTDMMRRAIVALRVFLERSWLTHNAKNDKAAAGYSHTTRRGILSRLRKPADAEVIESVRKVVEEFEAWEGWPSDEEVEEYAADKRFEQTKLP